MEFKEVVRNRYSCKKYSDRPVEPEKLAQALNLPVNEEILMVMDLGYAAEGTGPLPNHESRRSLADTVSYM